MKQKFKDLLKKKPVRSTIAEMMIDPAFTVLTDEQKAGKKAGIADDALVHNNFESSAGLMNLDRLEPKLTRMKRGGDPTLHRGLPEVVITATPINNGGYDPFGYNPFGGPSNQFYNHYNSPSQVDVTIANYLKKVKEQQMAAEAAKWKPLPTSFNIDATLNKIEQLSNKVAYLNLGIQNQIIFAQRKHPKH